MEDNPIEASENTYRKKPIKIEAFQMTRERRGTNSGWPEWLHKAWQKDHVLYGSIYPSHFPNSDGKDRLQIFTLEGIMEVDWDDWIIRGEKGELYPCKPDIFELTYEKV